MLGIDVYKGAWEVFRKNLARLLIAVVLSSVYMGVLLFIAFTPLLIAIVAPSLWMLAAALVLLLMIVAVGAVGGVIGGYLKFIHDSSRGKPEFTLIHSYALEKLVPFAILYYVIFGVIALVVGVPFALGLLLNQPVIGLALGGIGLVVAVLVGVLTGLAPYAMVADSLGPIDAIRKSIAKIQKDPVNFIVVIAVTAVINLAVNIVPILGFVLAIVVAPLFPLAFFNFYKAVKA
jgi:hypothetical protein